MSCLGYSSTKRTKSTTPRVNLGANPDGVGTNTIVGKPSVRNIQN